MIRFAVLLWSIRDRGISLDAMLFLKGPYIPAVVFTRIVCREIHDSAMKVVPRFEQGGLCCGVEIRLSNKLFYKTTSTSFVNVRN